ncbi:hypothetical protein [Streptomyces sp. NBC_00728]|uniref:hypothetical protein n=1 Tax=Streptomyces sp. NBC_00728 TaxID=2903676 RepID=UPI0038641DC1
MIRGSALAWASLMTRSSRSRRLEEVNDPRPALEAKLARWEERKGELEDQLLDGDRPAREIQDAIDELNVRMAHAHQEVTQYRVKVNISEISAAELRKAWKDYSVPRKQPTYHGLIREILIHPATRPFNVWNPDRVEVLWR